jgi:hypothetical protein
MDSTRVLFHSSRAAVFALFALLFVGFQAHAQTDPLPSWNDGPAKQAIVAFVRTTTTQDSPKFIPLAERIATFDQDGTLWVAPDVLAGDVLPGARPRGGGGEA